jgi:hypothetical protein
MKNAMRIAVMSVAPLIALSFTLAAPGPPVQSTDPAELARQQRVLREAMKSKLHHTQELVEALAVEDFEQLTESARALRAIAQETLWKVSPDPTYVKYSAEFASVADELARRGKENDLDGATLSYVRLTINCIECHKFARDHKIITKKR